MRERAQGRTGKRKHKAGVHLSSILWEPLSKGGYSPLGYTRGKRHVACGVKAKWWELPPSPALAKGFQGSGLC